MDSEDPGLAPLNGMMLDLRHAALEYLAKGSRVAEMVIAMLDASPERLPAASVEPVAWVRVIDEALVCSHLDVADQADDYATAKRKLNNLLAHEQSIGAFFAAQSAPRLKWMEAPRRTEWGAGMMEALIALGVDETLRLYAHRDDVPMVDALLPAQPAPALVPLTDEQAESLIENSDGRWHDGEFRIDGPDLMKLLRDAAQPAPARVPLTGAEIASMQRSANTTGVQFLQPSTVRWIVRAIEAAHGITAQGEPK